MRFDLNQYSIPPEAVGRQLTLAASDTFIRILDGANQIACHTRSYDRGQLLLDPAHQDAVLKSKRKACHSTPAGRLEHLVPESKTFLDQAFAHGESAAHEALRLAKLLEHTALRPCGKPLPKHSNVLRHVLLRWPFCCAANRASRPWRWT